MSALVVRGYYVHGMRVLGKRNQSIGVVLGRGRRGKRYEGIRSGVRG